MSEKGTFSVDRALFDHPMFADEPFTEREAWQWMISEAAFRPYTRRIGHLQLPLCRGQLAASVRFLAERWQWHRCKVERFLRRLKTGTMIETEVETGISLITICNYDRFQPKPKASETPNEKPIETAARQPRDKEETLNHSTIKKVPSLRSGTPNEFEEWYSGYPHKVGRAAAEKAFVIARRKVELGELVAARERYIAAKPPDRQWCNPATWLNGERWLDRPENVIPIRGAPNGSFAGNGPQRGTREETRQRLIVAFDKLDTFIESEPRSHGPPNGGQIGPPIAGGLPKPECA